MTETDLTQAQELSEPWCGSRCSDPPLLFGQSACIAVPGPNCENGTSTLQKERLASARTTPALTNGAHNALLPLQVGPRMPPGSQSCRYSPGLGLSPQTGLFEPAHSSSLRPAPTPWSDCVASPAPAQREGSGTRLQRPAHIGARGLDPPSARPACSRTR